MKFLQTVLIGVFVLAGASMAFAGPLLPSLPGVCGGGAGCIPLTGVAGESTVMANDGSSIRVDWIVMDAAAAGIGSMVAGEFAYIYQIENPDTGNPFVPSLNDFTLNVPALDLTSSGGFISTADLDVGFGTIPGHVPGAIYPNLGAPGAVETDTGTVQDLNFSGVGIAGLTNVTSNTDFMDNNITWSWNNDPSVCAAIGLGAGGCPPLFPEGTFGLGVGGESGIFFYTSTKPPVYGNGRIINSKTFDTTNAGSDRLPVPAPEPGTVLLLGLGLLGVGASRKRF